jgi:NDP-sugar pyrophosphorylase family protein
MEVIVLCGGLGTRLASVAPDIPKALAPIAGRPFLEWQLGLLHRQGLQRFILATGHRADLVEAALGDGSEMDVSLIYARERRQLGTGGAARNALTMTHGSPLLVANGDTYYPFDLRALVSLHGRAGARVTMQLAKVDTRDRFGSVVCDADGNVLSLSEKGASDGGYISAGVYVVEREVLEALPTDTELSLERDVLPGLIGGGLVALPGAGAFVDIGTPESYRSAPDVILAEEERAMSNWAATQFRAHVAETAVALAEMADSCDTAAVRAGQAIADAFRSGAKLLLCGNGGSAADCQHVAAEFLCRFNPLLERPGLPAMALTTDSSFLTAYANDFDFEGVFARQVEAHGRPGDVLLCISTSGQSANVRAAIFTARRHGVTTIGLFGAGTPLSDAVDIAVPIPGHNTQVVQECMLAMEHAICDIVESTLYPEARGRTPESLG